MPDEVPDRPSQDEEAKYEQALERVHQVEHWPVQLIGADPPRDQLHRPIETHQEEEHQADEKGSRKSAEEPLVHPVGVLVSC